MVGLEKKIINIERRIVAALETAPQFLSTKISDKSTKKRFATAP